SRRRPTTRRRTSTPTWTSRPTSAARCRRLTVPARVFPPRSRRTWAPPAARGVPSAGVAARAAGPLPRRPTSRRAAPAGAPAARPTLGGHTRFGAGRETLCGVETAREVLLALTRRYAFGEVAALVAAGAAGEALTTRDGARIDQLCAFGQRLLDLDAEDFGK